MLLLWRRLLYAYSFALFGFLCLIFCPFVLPLALLPARWSRKCRGLTRTITHKTFVFVRWHCNLSGFASMHLSDRSEGRRGLLLVANHLSMFDIVLLFSYFKNIHTLVNAKFTRNPLLWPIIRAAGYIPLRTDSPEDGSLAYEQLRELLRSGQHLVLFPEGTRSASGQLGPLKKGPFRLASELQIPITPIFFTCNQPFLNRRAFVPREPGGVKLEAYLMPQLDHGLDFKAQDVQRDFLSAYEAFIHSPLALSWNRACGVSNSPSSKEAHRVS